MARQGKVWQGMVWGCGSATGRSHFFVADLNWNEPDKVKIYTLRFSYSATLRGSKAARLVCASRHGNKTDIRALCTRFTVGAAGPAAMLPAVILAAITGGHSANRRLWDVGRVKITPA
jgi:hypothetical protein